MSLFSQVPSMVSGIAQSTEHQIAATIENAAASFKNITNFSLSSTAQGFSFLIKLYGQAYIDFGHNSSAHILSHCLYCKCPIVSPNHKTKKCKLHDITDICSQTCADCKRIR